MTLDQYIQNINSLYKRGNATEHSFRSDLQHLVEALAKGIKATNEPRRIDCGAPDYVITRNDVPIGYIEAKDIDTQLSAKQHKEQFNRYRNALDNLIITDYLDFEFYTDGEFITSVRIGEIRNESVIPLAANFDKFTQLIQDFCRYEGQTIKNAKNLAKLMAGKARLLAESLEKSVEQDEQANKDSELLSQYDAFKRVLIDTITYKEFADIYAQTIAYGMFAARLHDDTLDTFSRTEAATKIPKSNPFLRRMFQYIAGYDLDKRIVWIVDALAEVFRHTDVAAILNNFGKSTQQHDPIIHFYETFLAEYDPKLRKSRGVWYTPEPVVNFIVRAVDDILKADFGIADGLASRETIEVERSIDQSKDKRTKDGTKKEMRTYHKVQILDPATGTGTFLAEVIKQIHKGFGNNKGMWNGYVSQHLIPRLNGFELLMASYAMAHLKMDLLLEETGYKAQDDQRFNIYLTNSLEESHPEMGTLFASWISDEANAANRIKRDTPVMCVIGNPPYSGVSQNNGKWISKLIDSYKIEPNTTLPLQERKHWLNDDYVKFIRYAQHFVEKNGTGVVAFINPHGFLDNPTFRGMRWNLLKTYDKIYTIDLHGNAKKKEICPDGSADENVFDIMQGVSINLFVKTGQKHPNELSKVFHYDLWGKREQKYDYLINNNISSIPFSELENRPPMYFMVQKDFEMEGKYKKGFAVNEVMLINSTGIQSSRDALVVDKNRIDLLHRIEYFANVNYSDSEIRSTFFGNKRVGTYLAGDTRGWSLSNARIKIQNIKHTDFIVKINYRPFDYQYIYYSTDMVDWSREKVMSNFINKTNIGLVIGRQGQAVGAMQWNLIFATNTITDLNLYYRGGGTSFPLYLYPDPDNPNAFDGDERRVNFDIEIAEQIAKGLNYCFVEDDNLLVDLAADCDGTLYPTDVLDYIYAVLHSPEYRETYKEFLKTDFPRVPYPKDAQKFKKLIELGSQIRKLHLMEQKGTAGVSYPEDGTNEVTRRIVQADFEITDTANQKGRVWINDTQYFDNVPTTAWNFYIGGYQPAQKWLKDRKDRTLNYDDIEHYRNITHALVETERLMKEVDEVGVM